MTTTRHLPLDQLHFGHDADPPINARRMGRRDDLDALAASLSAHGQIQSLSVRTIAGRVYVADGNRRLAALQLLASRGEIPADHPVKIDDEFAGEADEISLAANVMRLPLHEADMFETFRELADRGATLDDIAGRFGIEASRVRRMLALGRLAPVILDAWRNGEFDGDAVQTVRAFTLAPDIESQAALFRRLKKAGDLYPHSIRRELGADDNYGGTALEFIGRAAYEAAGGHVTEDLFGSNHVLSDRALAERMVADRLEAERDRLLEDGWSWASLASDMKPDWSYTLRRLDTPAPALTKEEAARLAELEALLRPGAPRGTARDQAASERHRLLAAATERAWSDAAKARSGAVLTYRANRGLEITCGVIKGKAAEKTAATSKGAGAAEAAPTLSNALANRLSVQATLATRAAITDEPRLGLVALLAGHLSRGYHGEPVRVRHEGMGHFQAGEREPFGDAFRRLQEMSDADLFRVAAGIAGLALDLTVHSATHHPFRGPNGTLANAIAGDRMNATLREAFDAADYFGGAAKPIVLQAITEAVNADQAAKAAKLKKADLIAFALANVVPAGWLPPELRTANYDGPRAAPPAPAEPPAEKKPAKGKAKPASKGPAKAKAKAAVKPAAKGKTKLKDAA